ncbi:MULTISPECIES: homogentisate phytyltransferase [Limnospira]|uniref:4-hydroxybenzoate octaprenyltransferase n=1 Tax=Limnospira indica PCC 8005 TaxID=376219 RepID=A0A9P1NX07_9CYAN|nr:homogentisate phytyltransferase [Limnospira indica]RAQ43784.1 homogentisate phytyltransferase [Arthrospira sp. O9.13F]CDM93181.1 4-hydroxybenzoate octaprenyltransferase [Limnospira indica PCC 8005]
MNQTSSTTLPKVTGNSVQKNAPWLYAFWKFSRPHTIIGTSLSVLGLFTIAFSAQLNPTTWENPLFVPTNLIILLISWIACLCGNIYIVGLNQLEDIEIDVINKPDLPLASGVYSRRQGQIIVATTGILAVILAVVGGPFLAATVGISLILGTAYSLPPIRLKRFPVWAALCIFTVRGVIVNLGLFCHFSQQLSTPQLWQIPVIPPTVWVLTLFILVFTFAIAIFKDIPDIEGDRQYHITTFTIRLGTVAVFNLARGVITICYLGMMAAAFLVYESLNPVFLVMTNLILLSFMWWQSTSVDLGEKQAIANFYQLLWKLFFLEYILFPIACLLG